jgi:hypothetical protein
MGSGGHAVAQSVGALRYKPEGRGSIHDALNGIFHPLTEMNIRNTFPETALMCRLSWNLQASASSNPQGLYSGCFYMGSRRYTSDINVVIIGF